MSESDQWKVEAKGFSDLIAKWQKIDRGFICFLLFTSLINSAAAALSFYHGHWSGIISSTMSAYSIWTAWDYRKKARKTNQAWLQCRNECLQKADQYA